MDKKTLEQIKSQIPTQKFPQLLLNKQGSVENGVNMSQNTPMSTPVTQEKNFDLGLNKLNKMNSVTEAVLED